MLIPRCWLWLLLYVIVGAEGMSRSGAAAQEPKARTGAGQKYALLVGIDDYSQLQDLRFCGADQLALRGALVKAGFPADHVFLLHDKAQEAKYRPSKGNIEKQLNLVLHLVERDDVLLVAFSGHGAHLEGKSYLLPAEADLDAPGTLISRDEVYQKLQDCQASLKLALIDACRNDPRPPGRRSATAKDDNRRLAQSLAKAPEGLMLFTSCGPGEISMEEEKFGHGVFMNFILEGFQGKADADGSKTVTIKELFTYAGLKTKNHVARNYNDLQIPRKDSKESDPEVDDYPLVKLDSGTLPKVADIPSEPPVLAEPVRPGEVTTNSVGMKLAYIPAGSFLMGSPAGEAGRSEDEGPQHRVPITKPFYLGVHEVRKGDFAKFVAATSYRTDAEKDGQGGWGWTGEEGSPFRQKASFTWRSWGVVQSDASPVVNVSWNDAVAFCEWLSGQEGKQYRLPTEAEWEYACRAGTTTRFYSGDDEATLKGVANVADASLQRIAKGYAWGKEWDDGRPLTSPVGKFRANAFGLHDMHGNVDEWCSDWYDEKYYAASLATDQQSPAPGLNRVYRGGSWVGGAMHCRSAIRRRDTRGTRYDDLGFRVARVPSTN